MDEATKKKLESVGPWISGIGAGLLGWLGYMAGGMLGREAGNPLTAHLNRSNEDLRNHERDMTTARFAIGRAGEFLRQSLLTKIPAERDEFFKAAALFAMMGHLVTSEAHKGILKNLDEERKFLVDRGINLPSWDRALDIVRERGNDILEQPDLKKDLAEVAANIAQRLEARDEPVTATDYDKSVWRIAYAYGKDFSDLSEAERAEVLQEHGDWTAKTIIGSRWAKHEPAPPAEPEIPKPF